MSDFKSADIGMSGNVKLPSLETTIYRHKVREGVLKVLYIYLLVT